MIFLYIYFGGVLFNTIFFIIIAFIDIFQESKQICDKTYTQDIKKLKNRRGIPHKLPLKDIFLEKLKDFIDEVFEDKGKDLLIFGILTLSSILGSLFYISAIINFIINRLKKKKQ